VQLEKPAASSAHSKFELGFEELKEKLALVLAEGFGGCAEIVVSGPLASIDHV
jgi:cobyric acid synthase